LLPHVQDSVFQCQLPHQFREVDCHKADLRLGFVDSNISSPPPPPQSCFVTFYVLPFLFFTGPMNFQFSPKGFIDEKNILFLFFLNKNVLLLIICFLFRCYYAPKYSSSSSEESSHRNQ